MSFIALHHFFVLSLNPSIKVNVSVRIVIWGGEAVTLDDFELFKSTFPNNTLFWIDKNGVDSVDLLKGFDKNELTICTIMYSVDNITDMAHAKEILELIPANGIAVQGDGTKKGHNSLTPFLTKGSFSELLNNRLNLVSIP